LDTPTPNDNLMYLLFELERAVHQGSIVWSPELTRGVQRRLIELIGALAQMAKQ
jgi:hypothetical protein